MRDKDSNVRLSEEDLEGEETVWLLWEGICAWSLPVRRAEAGDRKEEEEEGRCWLGGGARMWRE